VNAVAPEPVRNRDFARVLGSVIGRPAVLPIPVAVLRAMVGEFAESLVASQRVVPEAALAHGFVFRYPDIESALRNLLASGSSTG